MDELADDGAASPAPGATTQPGRAPEKDHSRTGAARRHGPSTIYTAAIAAQVAAVMASGTKPNMVVPPPRVGAAHGAAAEEDENFDPLNPRV